jgi:CCR4-NOT transcription complex subunit 4
VNSLKTVTASVDRKSLHNFRVVQRNLIYVIGLPIGVANEDLLRRAEYFGQYGKITKIVAHKNTAVSAHPTSSAYVTFAFKEDAKAAIQALDGHWIEGHPLRASFGTTKYCNNFIKNTPCSNPECVYLHEFGDDDDRLSKEDIQVSNISI